MLKRQLGKSILELSLIGFGAAPLGGLYGNIPDATALIKKAFQLGITYFDTSPYYGNSEEVLGKCLKILTEPGQGTNDGIDIKRDSYVLSTKVGRVEDDIFNYSPEGIGSSLENSLTKLNTTYIDIFLLHDIEFGNLDEIMTISVPYLIALRKEGKVNHIGFSTYRLDIVRTVSKYPLFKELDVLLLYGHNNLINNSLETIRPLLDENNIGLIDASPLALGLLRDTAPPNWHPTTNTQRELTINVANYISRVSDNKYSLSYLAVYYTLTNMIGSSLLIGMETIEQLEANMEVYYKVLTIGHTNAGQDDHSIDTINALITITKDKLLPLRGIDIS